MFHFMFVHHTLSSVLLLSGHLLGNSCPLAHCILSICNIYLFPSLVLGAEFAF